jgi:hypothetical protein
MAEPSENGGLDSIPMVPSDPRQSCPFLLHFYCRKGFYSFLFESKVNKRQISELDHFGGANGLSLKHWSLKFNPEDEVPNTLPALVHLPFPLILWDEGTP